MNIILKVSIYILCTYLIAGIPFAFILTRLFLKQDIRNIGSGNVGATNVYRAGGLKLAIPVFLLDFLKGLIPTLISIYMFRNPDITILVVISAILGHILSPYLKFQGGKGAATSFGALVVFMPIHMGITLILFIVTVAITRVVALGTIMAAIAVPLLYFILGYLLRITFPFAYSGIVMALISTIAAFVIIKHRSNIQRMIKGKENKI